MIDEPDRRSASEPLVRSAAVVGRRGMEAVQQSHLLVLVHAAEPELLAVAASRLAELPSVYAPQDLRRLAATCRTDGRALLGAMHDAGVEPDQHGCVSWGRRASFTSADDLISAPDSRLAALPTPSCVAALGDARGRLATSSGPLQCLYESSGAGLRVWSTHALAAALVAQGDVALDPLAVAELVACEFVGGAETLFRGVRALAPGTVVDVEAGRVRVRECLSDAERWAPLDRDEAAAAAEELLVADLAAAMSDAAAPALGLTAGLDSRTVAVALAEIGVDVRAATFNPGDRGADVEGARELAAALGLRHEVAPMAWWRPEDDGHERVRAAAAWHDGEREAGYGAVVWPSGTDRWIAGVGAETGRAFYWRWLAPRSGAASPRTLTRTLQRAFEPRLVDADASTVRALRRRWRGWVEEALATGHAGWDTLDVVYAEQRVRRWGRAQVPLGRAEFVPAYASRELARALASLPLHDRLHDGWQRRFLRARRPDLEPPAPELRRPSRGALRRDQLLLAARRARRRTPGSTSARPTPDVIWHELDFWRERREYIDWLVDAVLDAPVLREALGDRWVTEQRRRFLEGDPIAAQLTRLAAGPVAVLESVARRRSGRAARPLPARR